MHEARKAIEVILEQRPRTNNSSNKNSMTICKYPKGTLAAPITKARVHLKLGSIQSFVNHIFGQPKIFEIFIIKLLVTIRNVH